MTGFPSGRLFAHYDDVPADAWRWPNFTPAELACRGTGRLKVDADALDKLQALRDRLGKPLIVTSAYRSPEHNKAVGGASGSQHLQGRAYDVMMTNHDPVDFEREARAVGFTGFGFYPPKNGGHNFIHVDTGPKREWGRRWKAAEYDDAPRPRLADRPATIGGVVTGSLAAAGGIAERAAENADAVIEQATNPLLARAVDALPYGMAAVGVIVVLALLARFWLRKRQEAAE